MNKIGWIGLGQMGTTMVERLLAKNIEVTVYNRTASKADVLVAKGAKKGNTVLEVVKSNEVIFLMIADYQATLDIFSTDVLEKISGKTIVNMSTISPTQSQAVAKLIHDNSGDYMEAPVSGSVGAAQAGSLLILTGGNKAKVELLTNIFAELGSKTFYYGEVGKGTGVKLVLNSLLGMFGEAYSEALLLAENFGINKEEILETISNSGMNSPVFQAKKDMLLTKQFPAAFMLKHMTKDLNLAKDEITAANMTLPTISETALSYTTARENGLGENDMASIYLDLEKRNSR